MLYRSINSIAAFLNHSTSLHSFIRHTDAFTTTCRTTVLCPSKAPRSSSNNPPRTPPCFLRMVRRAVSSPTLSSSLPNTASLRLPHRKTGYEPAPFQKRFLHHQAKHERVQAFLDARENVLKKWKLADGPDRLCESITALWAAVDVEVREELKAMRVYGYSSDLLDGIDEGLRFNAYQLKPDTPWGMVVYRASYGDNAAWEQILRLLLECLVEGLEISGRLDLLPRHRFNVVDDPSQFDGATPERVRKHFNKWVPEELKRNWREPPMPDKLFSKVQLGERTELDHTGVRYNFCLLIDDICLESLDENLSGLPVAKLVSKHEPYVEDMEYEEETSCPWEGGMTDNEFENVGWMYKKVCDYVHIHDQLQQPDDFYDEAYYRRPPLLECGDEFERAPGYWRRNGTSSGRG